MSPSTHERHVRFDLTFQQDEDNQTIKDSETTEENRVGEDDMTLSFSFLALLVIAAVF
jgi:hypothetical protein